MSAPPATWQPGSIKRIVEMARPTASRVVVVETSQGNGYLKAMGNPAGTHSLAAELVATRLARWLGLSTLTEAVVEVTGVPPIELDPGRPTQPGPAFITRAENGTPWSGQVEGVLDALVNPEDLARMVAFDTWIRNCDRYLPRPGQDAHANRDNVFLSTEGAPQGRFVMKPIDHAQCFCFATEFTSALLRAAQAVQDDRRFGYFPEFSGLVNEQDLRRAVAKINTIRRGEIEALFVDVPPAWGVVPEIRDAWCDLIGERALFLARNVGRLCSNL